MTFTSLPTNLTYIVKVNQRAKYVGQTLFSSKVIILTPIQSRYLPEKVTSLQVETSV